MRQLTKKQKKILTSVLEHDTKGDIIDFNSLSWDIIDTLESINDTEILWQEVDRFISDYRFMARSRQVYFGLQV
jgi:hypothetical protein